MELIGIILAGILMGAFLFASYEFGFYMGHKSKTDEGLTLTENNKDAIEEMIKWTNFDGRR